jgi:hypothetical protein
MFPGKVLADVVRFITENNREELWHQRERKSVKHWRRS